MKKIIALTAAAAAALGAFSLTAFAEGTAEKVDDIVILYTNDVHCGIDDTIGYDGLALYKREMEAQHEHVLLVDAGDAIQGATIGSVTKGKSIIELMDAVGYDAATLGNHEFDYTVPVLAERASELECGYISCNFMLKGSTAPVYKPYEIFDLGDEQIAFVGVTTPETFTTSTPTFFQNEEGEYIYDFCQSEGVLYDVVQKNVDSARAEGADYVILLGHLGESTKEEQCSAPTVVSKTSGIDVVIDGHSHEVTPCLKAADKDGKEVIITQTGTKLANIGKLTIGKDGLTTELIDSVPEPDSSLGFAEDSYLSVPERDGRFVDAAVNAKIGELKNELNEKLSVKLGHTDFKLYDTDPETGLRRVRTADTNLSDLCADAYRYIGKTDIGMANGGDIRKCIEAGDITLSTLLDLYPFDNNCYTAEITGQQLLDLIEFCIKDYPGESGAFPHFSGLEYTFDPSVKSSVSVNEYGVFTDVTGEYRVKEVLVGGEALDPEKTYTITAADYRLKDGGDGWVFIGGCKSLTDLGVKDVDALSAYITEALGGEIPEKYSDPCGEGRTKLAGEGSEPETPDEPSSSVPDEPSSSAPEKPLIQPTDFSAQRYGRQSAAKIAKYEYRPMEWTYDTSSHAESSSAASVTAAPAANSSAAASGGENPNTGAGAAVTVTLAGLIAAAAAVRRKNK